MTAMHKPNFHNNFAAILLVLISFCLSLSLALADQAAINFTILHTSDEHSTLLPVPLAEYHPTEPNPSLGGFARLASKVKEIREANNADGIPTLLFSSGDFMGGSPFAWLILAGQSPELEIMLKLGYDGITLGNHEFDYGPEVLAQYMTRLQQENDLPIVAANYLIPEDHEFAALNIQPQRMIELANGLKIGLFGIMGESSADLIMGSEPLSFSNAIEAAQKQVATLKESGAQLIIALTHSGINEDRELAQAVAGIDLILGGHNHVTTQEPELINNCLVFHSGYYLNRVGRLDLAYDKGLKVVNSDTGNPFHYDLSSEIKEDPEFKQIIDDYTHILNEYIADFTRGKFTDISQTLVKSDFPLIKTAPYSETVVGNYIADAMRLEAQKVLGEKVDFAFQANGIIRANINPGTMPWSKGKISFYDLASTSDLGSGSDGYPGYALVSFYLNAEEVYRLMEIGGLLPQLWGDIFFLQVSGLRLRYDPDRAFWFKNIPFVGLPIPSYKAVLSIDRSTEPGLQHSNYEPLKRNSNDLYNIVTTHYIASYLPRTSGKMPALKIEFKNKSGKVIDLEECIIDNKGRQLKTWEAVALYALSHEKNDKGTALIPDYYRQTTGRTLSVKATSLWLYPGLSLALLLLIIAAIKRYKNKASN